VETAIITELPENAQSAQLTVEFGSSIAVSGDRVAIGARESQDGTGFVTVFRADTNPWTIEELSLRDINGAPNDQFGYHVAMDDDVLVAGAPFRWSSTLQNSGAAYISNRTGSSWSTPVILASPNVQSFANFGHSVAIAGNLIAVAAPFENSTFTDSGAVYIYKLSSGTWTHVRTFTAPTAVALDQFGFAIAMEGTTLVVGAPRRNLNGTDTGAVFVYDLSDSTPSNWSLTATLQNPSPVSGQRLGYSVAIRDDLIVAGAPEDTTNIPDDECPPEFGNPPWGAVHAFRHDGSNWVHEQRIVRPGNVCNQRFGSSLALTDERLLVGGGHVFPNFVWSAYLYGKTGSGWAMMRFLDPGPQHTPTADLFGFAVGFLAPDQPIVGAPAWLDEASLVAGRVYAFDVPFHDCNDNGIDDCLEIAAGDVQDCNGNGIPDCCDLVGEPAYSLDINNNGIPDECEPSFDCGANDPTDCNNNGIPDACERSSQYDLIFVIDQNRTVVDNLFERQKEAMKAVICGFGGFGPLIDETSPIRIAVIGYFEPSICEMRIHIPLTVVNPTGGGSEAATPAEFCALIDNIVEYLGLGKPLSSALECAAEEFLDASNAYRRQVVILSDLYFGPSLPSDPFDAALLQAAILRTLRKPNVSGLDAGVSVVGVTDVCDPDPFTSDFLLNLVNHLNASEYDPSQPRGLVECGTDLAGLYAGMQRIIIQNLLRCPDVSEDVPVCGPVPWTWDCNGNGIPDCIDILTRRSLDLDEDGIPDECQDGSLGPCPADLDGDFGVNSGDLIILLSAWGPCGSGPCPADLNDDGEVNSADLLELLNAWGACYSMDTSHPCTAVQSKRYEILPPQSIADCMSRYGGNTAELIGCIEAMILAGTP